MFHFLPRPNQHQPSPRQPPRMLAAWALGLLLLTLASCGRATYVFSSRDYLGTERSAPATLPPPIAAAIPPAPLPSTLKQAGKPAPAHPAKHRRLKGAPARLLLALAPRATAGKLLTQPITRLRNHHNTKSLSHSTSPAASGTMLTSLLLLAGSLICFLVASGASANIVGALFGVALAVVGSLLLVAGLVLLVVSLSNGD